MVATVSIEMAETESKPEANGIHVPVFRVGSAVWYQPEDGATRGGPAEIMTTTGKGYLIKLFIHVDHDPSEKPFFKPFFKSVKASELSIRTKSLSEILCDGGIGE